MYFAYRKVQLTDSVLVEVLKDDGSFRQVTSFYTVPAAKKLLAQWYKNDIEWTDRPWENPNIDMAKKNWEEASGCPWDGRFKDEKVMG